MILDVNTNEVGTFILESIFEPLNMHDKMAHVAIQRAERNKSLVWDWVTSTIRGICRGLRCEPRVYALVTDPNPTFPVYHINPIATAKGDGDAMA